MNNITLTSESLLLRNTCYEDLDFIVTAEGDSYNAQFVTQWSKEAHRQALSQEDILHLILEESATHDPVGYIIMAGLTNPDRNIEFKRIVITSKGKGYGRQALRFIKAIAFDHLQAHRLWLDVRVKNNRAQGLYESEGFVKEGILRECVYYNGQYESIIIMSILAGEYRNLICSK